MKIVVVGGHLSPALSVLNRLKEDEVLYIGRKYTFEADKTLSLEYRVVSSIGINFKNITTGRLQRNFSFQTILSLFKFPTGLVQSFFVLRNFKPDVVLGFGGYVQFPVVLAAFIFKIPIVIHEQGLKAGLANKISSIFAKKILISWVWSKTDFPNNKTVFTGIPLRPEVFTATTLEKSQDPLIYITGGSSGSHSINVLVEHNLEKILKYAKIFHQTGDAKEFGDFDRLSEKREKLSEELKKKYMLMKFVDSKDAAKLLKSADLVIGRSGMNTISEIIYFQKPALLIPLSFGSEQKRNALFLKELGLAEVLNEDSLSDFQFQNAVEGIVKNLESYKLKVDPKTLIREDAVQRIIEETYAAKKI